MYDVTKSMISASSIAPMHASRQGGDCQTASSEYTMQGTVALGCNRHQGDADMQDDSSNNQHCCSRQQHQRQPVDCGSRKTETNLLLARVIELCQTPVYEPELPLLMINHDLHKAAGPNTERQYASSHVAIRVSLCVTSANSPCSSALRICQLPKQLACGLKLVCRARHIKQMPHDTCKPNSSAPVVSTTSKLIACR